MLGEKCLNLIPSLKLGISDWESESWEFKHGKVPVSLELKRKVDSLWHILIYVTLGHLSIRGEIAYLTCIPLTLPLLGFAVHLLFNQMSMGYEMVWRTCSSKITGCSLNFVRHNDLTTLISLMNVPCSKHLPFTNRYTKLYWLIGFLCC